MGEHEDRTLADRQGADDDEPSESLMEAQGPDEDQRILATLAHASILLNLVTGLGGLVVAFLIWITQKDRSTYVEDQALQSLAFQAAVVGLTVAVAIVMSVSFASICLIPIGALLAVGVVGVPIGGCAYGIYAATKTYQGLDFKYRWIADAVRAGKERAGQ